MTEKNFNYRTSPMFLRNQFYSICKNGIPMIPKFDFEYEDIKDIRLIGFDKVKNGKDEHVNRLANIFQEFSKPSKRWLF